jgi:hypothetical protein
LKDSFDVILNRNYIQNQNPLKRKRILFEEEKQNTLFQIDIDNRTLSKKLKYGPFRNECNSRSTNTNPTTKRPLPKTQIYGLTEEESLKLIQELEKKYPNTHGFVPDPRQLTYQRDSQVRLVHFLSV